MSMDRERRNEILARIYAAPAGVIAEVFVGYCPPFDGAPAEPFVISEAEAQALADAGLISSVSPATRRVIGSDHGRQYWLGIKPQC